MLFPVSNKTNPAPRRIVILATPTVQALEVAGPAEVFGMGERKRQEAGRDKSPRYVVEVVAAGDELTVRGSSGLTIMAGGDSMK